MATDDSDAADTGTPCSSCPYRADVPSGVWDWDEYEKLRRYDEDPANPDKAIEVIGEVFLCHQPVGSPEAVCRGWAEVHYDTPAVRMAMITGKIDPDTLTDPRPGVTLFPSGATAADHGQAEIDSPSAAARSTITKVARRRRNTALRLTTNGDTK